MVGYEIRKLLQKSATKVFLAIILLLNGILVWNQDIPGGGYRYGAAELKSLYAALPADGASALAALESQREALGEGIRAGSYDGQLLTEDIYTESSLFRTVIERVEPAANYEAYLANVDANAEALLASGLYADAESFAHRNIISSQKEYRALADVKPQVFYSGAVELLPGGRMTDLTVVLLCLLLCLEMTVAERTSGTLALVKPSKNGRTPLYLAKMLTCILAIITDILLLYGTNLILGIFRCGGFPVDAPIQSVFGFQGSPWKISVGAYIALFLLQKILWGITLGSMILLMCLLAKDSISACVLSVAAFVPSLSTADDLGIPGCISLINAGDTAALFAEYRNLDFFEIPVSAFMISTVSLTVTFVICFGAGWMIHNRRSPLPVSRKRRAAKHQRISTNLFAHEAYKLLVMNGGAWIMAALILVQGFTYWDFEAYINPSEKVYMMYSETLSGKADGTKDVFIEEETQRFAELQAELDNYSTLLASGEIDELHYDALASSINQQLSTQCEFERAKEQYLRMKELDYDYVCLTGYNRLLGEEGLRDLIVQAIKLVLTLILGLAAAFAIESESKMDLLLGTTIRRQTSAKYKAVIACVYGLVAAVIAFLPQVIAIATHYGLLDLSAPAGSVETLGIFFGSILSALLFYGCGILLLALACAIGILLLSKKTANVIQTILYAALVFLMPMCLLLLVH